MTSCTILFASCVETKEKKKKNSENFISLFNYLTRSKFLLARILGFKRILSSSNLIRIVERVRGFLLFVTFLRPRVRSTEGGFYFDRAASKQEEKITWFSDSMRCEKARERRKNFRARNCPRLTNSKGGRSTLLQIICSLRSTLPPLAACRAVSLRGQSVSLPISAARGVVRR